MNLNIRDHASPECITTTAIGTTSVSIHPPTEISGHTHSFIFPPPSILLLFPANLRNSRRPAACRVTLEALPTHPNHINNPNHTAFSPGLFVDTNGVLLKDGTGIAFVFPCLMRPDVGRWRLRFDVRARDGQSTVWGRRFEVGEFVVGRREIADEEMAFLSSLEDGRYHRNTLRALAAQS